ncbi:MAG: hypothetical protein MOGMAGMI_01246 [Candidatus Omnitrophica bacterium]|nr:hypothetical protein [Candidatus Omnitrophota bacterium]
MTARIFLLGLTALLAPASAIVPMSPAQADTIHLKDGTEIKGLIVEEHADRLVLSTEKGEAPLMRSTIKEVEYSDPAQTLFQIAKSYEAEEKYGEALAYYEKASELNPDLQEAKIAASAVRNRFWATSTQGPVNEIEKQQVLLDAWGQGKKVEEVIHSRSLEQQKSLRESVGLTLERKNDWVRLGFVDTKKEAGLVGLKRNDRLVAIDGESLRYLSEEVVRKMMLTPRLTNYTLEYERDLYVRKEPRKTRIKDLGFKLKLEYKGLIVSSVEDGGSAGEAGLQAGDLITRIDGEATRYLPIRKARSMIESGEDDRLVLTVRRSAYLTRK